MESTPKGAIIRVIIACCLAVSYCVVFGADHREPEAKVLYEAHQWFRLRNAIKGTRAASLYRGAVESAFNNSLSAQKDLQTIIKAVPHSEEAYRAHDLLVSLFMRAGNFQQALLHDEAMLAAKPSEGDAMNLHSLLAALSSYPNQIVTQRRSSKITYRIVGNNMFIPLSINGAEVNYLLDTGATLSTISESEAARLKLRVHEVATRAEGGTGVQISVRVSVARKLAVGGVYLRNVAFVVVPDGRPPFSGLSPGMRGIIGLPVILAFEALRWGRNGSLEIGFPPKSKNTDESNLCFDDVTLLTEVQFLQSDLSVMLDTGATHSELWPNFAKRFAKLLKESGSRNSTAVTGVGGDAEYPTAVLSELTFRLGGRDTILRPALVFLRHDADASQWHYGEVGLDILNQGHSVTLDFRSMTLSLE